MMISILIPTKNEELNIEDCLRSVATYTDDVVVIDSYSTDNTRKIAENLGFKVVDFDYSGGWPKKKNWAIENVNWKYEWIFILDADERVSKELWEELLSNIKADIHQEINSYSVRWEFYFMGKHLKYSWNGAPMIRIFRKGYGQYENLGMTNEGGWDNEVHEHLIVPGKTKKLKRLLIHKSRSDLHFWLQKQNEFSTWNSVRRFRNIAIENDKIRGRRLAKNIFLKLPLKPLIVWFYIYVLKRGFLDGRLGWHFAISRAIHEYNNNLKLLELKLTKK